MSDDTVQACPECDSPDLSERVPEGWPEDRRWLCRDCRHEFAEPDERPRNPRIEDTTAATLEDLDPSEVFD